MNWVPCNIPGCLTCKEQMKGTDQDPDEVTVAALLAKAEQVRRKFCGEPVASGTNGDHK